MSLIVAETGGFLDCDRPDPALVATMYGRRAAILNPLDRLPDYTEGLDLDAVANFLGAICIDPKSLRLLVTDTSTPEAQQALLEAGITTFLDPDNSGGATIPAIVSVVDRNKHDTPRGVEWSTVHELTHQGANVFVKNDPSGVGPRLSPPGLTRIDESGSIKNAWEEGRAQLNAAGYDLWHSPNKQGRLESIGGLAVPARYLCHPSRPNTIAESGLAAVSLELLINKDWRVLDHLVGAEKWIGSWYFLREKINRLAPREADLFDQINSLPPDALGYARGMRKAMDVVYPNGDYPQGEELGRVSSKYYAEAVRKHMDRSSLRGKIHHALKRWLGASDYEGRTI